MRQNLELQDSILPDKKKLKKMEASAKAPCCHPERTDGSGFFIRRAPSK
jgi:hypothetical protein